MYKISLLNFEGPFDLLLYFIKRDEINIYDIPIVKITGEFLNYIRLMRIFDLELAGEFLVMASTLMYIKTQMLLPKPKSDDENEIEDPRSLLVKPLLEYKQMKVAAGELMESAEQTRYSYYRQLFDADSNLILDDSTYENSSIFDLLRAFQTVMDRKKMQINDHVIKVHSVSIEDRSKFIMDLLNKRNRVGFFDITAGESKQSIIVTFLAILELIKLRRIYVRQSQIFEDITIALTPNLN